MNIEKIWLKIVSKKRYAEYKEKKNKIKSKKLYEDKIKTKEEAGITIAKSPAEIGKTLYNKLSL